MRPRGCEKPASTSGRFLHGRRVGESGTILVVVMLIMIVLLGLGMSGLVLTNSSVQSLTNTNLRSMALYVAEAGLERARDILNGPIPPDFADILGGADHPFNAADEIPHSLDPAYGMPIGRGAILTDAAGVSLWQVNYPVTVAHDEPVPGNPLGLSSPLMGSYTVYIRNDNAECRMGQFTVDTNKAVVVRSEGTAMDGKTTVVLEMTMGAGNGAVPGEGAGGVAPVLCNSGKNACDDNNSVQNNVVVAN